MGWMHELVSRERVKFMKESNAENRKSVKGIVISPMTILTCVFVLLLLIAVFIPFMLVKNGSKSMYSNYMDNYEKYSNQTEKAITNFLYDLEESINHSSGSVYINLGDIQEVSNLQVYEVGHDAYVVENKEDNPKRTTLWLCYTAVGTYKVDLSNAEFAVDNINRKVTVTIPELEFNWTFVYEDSEVIFEADDLDLDFTNNGKVAEQIQARLLSKANDEMVNYFINNQENDSKAKQAAKDSIERMIKLLNPEIEDIIVEVNYY